MKSIIPQIGDSPQNEVLIIDNSLEGNNPNVRKWSIHPQIKYFWEPRVGLSYARNRGYQEAMNEWVCYLDDDTRVLLGFFCRLEWIATYHNFDCFGGTYRAWFKYGKPKWIPERFGTKEPVAEKVTTVSKPKLSGGIFAIKKSVLMDLNGFNTKLGMGKRIGYGEETDLQLRILETKYILGYDPFLVVDHCVLAHKLELRWHLKFFIAKGKANQLVHDKRTPFLLFLDLWQILTTTFMVKFPLGIYRLFFEKAFYWQNYVLYSLEAILLWYGRFKAACSPSK